MGKRIQTKLKFGKKTHYLIIVDDEKWGILTNKVLHQFSITSKWFATDEEIKKISEQILKFAWEKVLKYLAYRERSTQEVVTYLQKIPLKNEFVEIIIKRARKNNYLDDNRFGDFLIQSLIIKNRSKKEITSKLIEKGIKKIKIDKLISEQYNDEIESNIIVNQVEKSLRRYSRFPHRKKREKCYMYLIRKGFAASKIVKYLDEILEKGNDDSYKIY
ncbi:MAG: RecX family transcriptional regulator [Candidatus Cloacimonadota bacterium]|nr:RecX family transcriptional regulator [Candidatus Cloacimonadota bacterium]